MNGPPDGHHFPGPGTLDRALNLVRFLRRECPWDAKQTAESLVPHLLEETHEVVDAIRDGDGHALEGELGDLLLNLAFQIVVAEEAGELDADSVYARLESKMIARHPHLFGNGEKQDWETLKAAEREAAAAALAGSEGADAGDDADGAEGARRAPGVLDDMARGLDPLTKAYRIQQKVAGVGFDWDDWRGPAEKVSEELAEVTTAIESGQQEPEGSPASDAVIEEIGDLLFAAVNLARLAGAHPTTALAGANAKFTSRFSRLEQIAAERGIELETAGLEVLDRIWNEVKETTRE